MQYISQFWNQRFDFSTNMMALNIRFYVWKLSFRYSRKKKTEMVPFSFASSIKDPFDVYITTVTFSRARPIMFLPSTSPVL